MVSQLHDDSILTAVITGGHDYDVIGFQNMFRQIPGVNAYLQSLEDFAADTGYSRQRYDVLLFYNMHLATPGTEPGRLGPQVKEAMDTLGRSEQGIFVLHHALVAFPDWELWGDICGIRQRRDTGGAGGQTVRLDVSDQNHPVTNGLCPWQMIDEVYTTADADEDSEVLLTTDHPESMSTIAWTRCFGNSRVFCYQSGHDRTSFDDPGFRTVLTRGVQWAAGRI